MITRGYFPKREEILSRRTPRGGFTRKQFDALGLKMGPGGFVPLPGWIDRIVRHGIEVGRWEEFKRVSDPPDDLGLFK